MRCSPKERKQMCQNPSFGGSKSFKVIDVDKSKKPVTSACYDRPMQQGSTYLQPFSHYKRVNSSKITFYGTGQYTSLRSWFKGNPLTQRHEILSRKIRDLGAAHGEDIVILACTVLIALKVVTDGRTDRRTYEQTPRPWLSVKN